MAPRSNRTAELTTEHLVAMFRDERQTVRLEAGPLFKYGDPGGSMYVMQRNLDDQERLRCLRERRAGASYQARGPRRSLG